MSDAFAEMLELVAKEHSVTPDEVYREIEFAIEMAMQNPDPEAQQFWAMMPRAGERPTPEEFIAYMSWKIAMTQ